MKKAISIILSIIISVLALSPCYTYIVEEIGKKNVLTIGNDISQMCAEYDDYDSLAQDDDKTIYTRLIVKANDIINEYGAVDSVYGFGYAFLQYADNKSAETAKKQYENLGYTVEYDSLVIANSDVSTKEIGIEWAYEETDAVAALDYYKLKVKSNINIAVVDSGINYNHESFKNRIVRTNVDFSPDSSNDEMDKYGHGTKVAGVIAKSTPDNVKISSYKIFNGNGQSSTSAIISACNYILQLSKKPDIVNFSLTDNSDDILSTAIKDLVNTGITVVAAAGNERREVYKMPASIDGVITVAATDFYSKPWQSSNFGGPVDISAPGVSVYTADFPGDKSYSSYSGTSLATPFVSAAAAIVLMENKNYTPEQVKQELVATATPFKKSDCQNLYGAGVVNFSNIINGTRCKDVTANFESGVYREDISVELKCNNSLVDIYYTTDGTLPTETNGTKYTSPINVAESTRIIAAAFARAGTPMHSKFTYLDYYIFKNGESEYVIDDNGTIRNYLGSETNLTVPKTINGITPTSISKKCFQYSDIKNINLPDTITLIDEYAFRGTDLETIVANGAEKLGKYCFADSNLQKVDFPNVVEEYYAFNNTPIISAYLPELDYAQSGFYNCDRLSSIDIPNLRAMDYEVFSGCSSLTQELKLTKLESFGNKAFAGSYFKSICLPKCNEILKDYAFENCAAQEIVLNNATTLGNNAFFNCKNLENLYVPKVKGLGSNFEGCTSLKMIFAPMTTGFSASIPSNAKIYCSNRLTSVSFPKEYADYKCTIFSPEYTPGLAIANSYGYADSYTHISSDKIAQSMGGQIRTRDNGLRFGFAFDENSIGFDFKKYAQSIDYGFVYTFESLDDKNAFQINDYLRENNSKVFVKSADKRNVEGTISTYNAVFTDIPEKYFNYEISVRAYVCIDGMYFYSPVETSSINDALEYNDDDTNDNDIQFEHVHSFTRSSVAPNCESSGYTLYICKNCKESYMDNFADALGHNYDFTGYTDGTYNYICTVCNKADSKSKSDLPEFIQYVNTNVTRGNNSMYLDLNNDEFINAKDFAKIHHLSKYGW